LEPQKGLHIFSLMKHIFLPWFLLFCAVGLSATAAYYSVIGLSIVFVGAATPVIIMGSFLEVSKIAIATYLHNSWSKIYRLLKIYLTVALVTLSIITSIGIYGLLSTGFQENIAKMEIGNKQIQNIEIKKQRYETTKIDILHSQSILDKDISQLRNALSTNTTTQYVDKKTGQMVIRANNSNRKTFESQLSVAQEKRDILSSKIDILNDSITSLDINILDMESKASEGNELGAVQYVSEITGNSLQTVANWFIFLLIFVFDPLAITLVIATNQAFSQNKPIEPLPKPKEPEPLPIEPEPQPEPYFPIPNHTEQEKLRIQQEIEKIQRSGTSMRKSGLAIQDLQNKIRDLDNIKTY